MVRFGIALWTLLAMTSIGCINEYEAEVVSSENVTKAPSEQSASDEAPPEQKAGVPASETPPSQSNSTVPPSEIPQETTEPVVHLKIQDWDTTYAMRSKHSGKVVIMDLWSTSCPPCMKEFPNLVQLHRQHRDEGLVCISVSCDYTGRKSRPPEFYIERVTDFLTKQQATFDNILLSTDSTTVTDAIDLAAIPAVYVFDRQGKVAKRFDNDNLQDGQMPFTYKDEIIPFVEELLKQER